MQGVEQELAYLNSIYAEKDIRWTRSTMDSYIYDALHLVTDSLYEASLLTIVVLLFSCAASAASWWLACRSLCRSLLCSWC